MKNIKQIFLLILCVLLLASCEKAILGPDANNDPVSNFEILWNDFDQHYGLFTARGTDWYEVYNTYKSQVTHETTKEELWKIFTEMIEVLDDTHTYIGDPDTGNYYTSGAKDARLAEEVFSLDLIEDKYLESKLVEAHRYEERELIAYSKIKGKDIGYLYMNDMDNNADFDKMYASLKDYKAIIIDLRNNHGGTDEYSMEWASYFSDGEHFVYTVETRNGPSYDDFDEKRSYHTTVHEGGQYLKPVIILTDKHTVSAAEIFLLHMKAFDHVTQMGDYTAGDFSDTSPTRFLPNGWVYGYSLQMYLLPDGSSIDGIGHTPEVIVTNTKLDIQEGNDIVLENAINYLYHKYDVK